MTTTNRMTTLADLEIGNPRTVLNLTAVPLSGNPASTLDYLLIDEALETKKVIVEEVSEGGSVPELRMTNFASKCVLIVDGTELVGAKQNRIVNASFLIPPESITRIPVSCVEQGRWGYKGREFGVTGVDLKSYQGIQVVCAEGDVVVTAYRNQNFRGLCPRGFRRKRYLS